MEVVPCPAGWDSLMKASSTLRCKKQVVDSPIDINIFWLSHAKGCSKMRAVLAYVKGCGSNLKVAFAHSANKNRRLQQLLPIPLQKKDHHIFSALLAPSELQASCF